MTVPRVSPCVALAIAALAWAASYNAPASATPRSPFEPHWQDGKAELAGYRYHVSRYGEPRVGQAVLVTVTEPFSESKRVKADDPSANPGDAFEALKVNAVRDFQTGIYDYNTMTSVFARTRDFSPVKVSFSSAEWCGHVYEELLFDPGGVRQWLRSYFEGESADRSFPRPPNGIAADELFILVRSLRGDFLRRGERRAISLLPSAIERRLAHRPLAWIDATISRSERAEAVRVPAGSFLVDLYRVKTRDDREGTFWVEEAYPHRIVRWAWNWSKGDAPHRPGARSRQARPHEANPREASESAELLGSTRLPYWQLHANGQESYLRALGLSPQPKPR